MSEQRVHEEAATWFARMASDEADWPGFTAWLEADPRHGEAYDELALLDDDLSRHADLLEGSSLPEPANDDAPRWRRWAGFGGGAVAAGLALLLAVQSSSDAPLPARTFAAPGAKSAAIALGDGTRVVLAPSSRLEVRGTQMALSGAAWFDVPHRPGREMKVDLGGYEIRDIGTTFTAVNDARGVEVAVGEGRLSVASDRLSTPVALSAGRSLVAPAGSSAVRLGSVDPAGVGAWRTGRLSFADTPLAVVAAEVSRYSGRQIAVDPAIAGEPFSGTIALHDDVSPAETLARIMALDVASQGGAQRLVRRGR
ncbi:inner membrane sensor for iron transport [Sphingomonas astaxanthinifaciens DSM 22298]|uniref:Inner membrane sensor for iron transport n=2 Tax=Sphingomonas TaxID=13687 RepID=A0ABQ5Z0R0_9SPHN|nr:inner membrane sensor for iron transport [Sphingomonas astaxanthinifaciens DSM 22298]